MKKYVIILFLILTLLLRSYFVIKDYKNIPKEEYKIVKGIITNIKKNNGITVVDIKSDKKYRVTIYDDVNYNLGDKVKVDSVFTIAYNNTVFNLFNYRKYLLSKNIKMVASNPKITLIKKNKNIFYKIKNEILRHINKYESSAYLKVFVMGDTSDIKEDLFNSYKNIGISHLFSISGMHVGLFLYFMNYIFKKFKHKNLIIFMFLLFMLFITNYTESFLRCFIFLFIKHINKRLDFKLSDVSILFITLILILIINPFLIYGLGIRFSIIITFYLILSKNLLKNKNYFEKLIVISIVCFLSSIPILASSFFKINILSFLFNLIFVPLVSIIIFPLGIITFVFPFLDSFYMLFINLLEFLSVQLDKVKILSFVISKPSILICFLYYLSLFLAIKINKKYIILFLIILIFNLNSRFFIMNPEIVYLDVGQGDSSVIILPKGRTILIDTGGNLFSNKKIVENKTIPYLNSKGINKIDFLILTHGDSDHMKEAKDLVNKINVGKVIFNQDNYNELEKNLIKVLKEKDIRYYKGCDELKLGKHKLYFLNTKTYDNENDNSNVIYFNFNNYKFLFMADAGKIKEKDIQEKYDLRNIHFLKVAHHGSNTSSSKEFIDQINPKYSIISVGKNNRYNHPNKSVLKTLSNSKIYRTDVNGSISIKLKRNKYKIKLCSP